MQIAVVSTDGVTVNEHFGRANRFLIFEIVGDRKTLVGVRASEPLSVGDPDHPFDPDRFEAVLGVLSGCARVYCSRIGERPARELEKAGIIPVVCDSLISQIK